MKTIFKVDEFDMEGRFITDTKYFEDQADAIAYQSKDKTYRRNGRIDYYEKGEYDPKKIARQQALDKLTPEDRKILGLE